MAPDSLGALPAQFSQCWSPAAILAMTGCREIGVNPALVEFERGLNPDLASSLRLGAVIQSEEEYIRVVAEAWKNLPRFRDEDEQLYQMDFNAAIEKASKCLCERLRALIALRFEDCPWEAQFRQFQNSSVALDPLPAYEFLLDKIDEKGVRTYRVARAFTRLVGPLYGAGETAMGLIQIRLVPSDHLVMVVRGIRSSQSFDVQLSVNGLPGSNHVWLDGSSPVGALLEGTPYDLMDRALEEAYRNPTAARAGFRTAMERMISQFRPVYPAALTLLADILRHEKITERLQREVQRLRHRLSDGRVLGEYIRKQLDGILRDDNRYSPLAEKLAVEQQADLEMLRIPLEHLEAHDRIAGFYEPPRGQLLPVPRV